MMKMIFIISMTLLLSSCAGKQIKDPPQREDIPENTQDKIPHAGRPMTTLINGVDFFRSDNFKKFIAGQNNETDTIQRLFLDTLHNNEQDTDKQKLYDNNIVGQTRLIFESLDAVVAEARLGELSPTAPAGTHPQCIDAYSEKFQWHKNNSNEIPATFGKITEYILRPIADSDKWLGVIDLCTWIGSDNYYFNISFIDIPRNTLSLKDFPFANTLDTLPPEVVEGFNYKLHSKGKGAVVYKNVFKNSIFFEPGHQIYNQLQEDCFDTFYVNKPTGDKAVDLADQIGYCMGRCSGIVLNTGR